MSAIGTIHGIGVGPGAPDLMSVRAARLIESTRHVAYFRKRGREGRARQVIRDVLRADAIEIPLEYPITTEIPFDDPRYQEALSNFYEERTETLRKIARAGHDIALVCEGDPFFYGSFMHIYERLRGDDIPLSVTPGITGMSGGWTATGLPITWGDDVLTVLMGTLPEAELRERMRGSDALVVMKIGRNLAKVRRALQTAGLSERAWFIEHATTKEERVRALSELNPDAEALAPYFSMVVVHGQGRRP